MSTPYGHSPTPMWPSYRPLKDNTVHVVLSLDTSSVRALVVSPRADFTLEAGAVEHVVVCDTRVGLRGAQEGRTRGVQEGCTRGTRGDRRTRPRTE
jgi:hypothetical protein